MTQDEIQQVWEYHQETDTFTWRGGSLHRKAGDVVNTTQPKQRIGSNRYSTKALISIYHTGYSGNTRISSDVITHTELLQILDYDPVSGIFTWKENRGSGAKIGHIAGCTQSAEHPYTLITINGRTYYAHRLAWLYVYGTWPSGLVDHIDRNEANNAICNLRDVGFRENRVNSKIASTNSSGYTGVVCTYGKFRAELTYLGNTFYLGTYSTPELAKEARDTFMLEHGICTATQS